MAVAGAGWNAGGFLTPIIYPNAAPKECDEAGKTTVPAKSDVAEETTTGGLVWGLSTVSKESIP